MTLTTNEINILKNIYLFQLNKIELEEKLNLSYDTVKRSLKSLNKLNFINDDFLMEDNLFSKILLDMIKSGKSLLFLKKPKFSLLLILLNKQLKIEEIIDIIGLSKTQVYENIKELLNIGVITYDENKKYYINSKMWNDLIELLNAYNSSSQFENENLPENSKFLFKTKEFIIFENNKELTNYKKTAFSAFDFKLFYNTNIYTTYSKDLTKSQIYEDALNISASSRELVLCAVYYLKHNLTNIKNSKHKKIVQILDEDKDFKGFPSKLDILDKKEND
jgi:predicted transcriptional regulator